MRAVLLLLVCISARGLAQKKMDVVSNVEAKVLALQPLGKNSLAQELKTFYGFGFAGHLMTPIHFGIGAEVDIFYSNVIYGKMNTYGNLGSPRLTVGNVYLIHRKVIDEDFSVESLGGISYFQFQNFYLDGGSATVKNHGMGLLLGAKALYILDPRGYQSVFAELRFQTFGTAVYNENVEIRNFYSKSYFATLGLGYRFNF